MRIASLLRYLVLNVIALKVAGKPLYDASDLLNTADGIKILVNMTFVLQ